MANGRMISKAISLDKRVDNLPSDLCKLAYTWSIPHLDRDGRIHGDPALLRSIVLPRRTDVSSESMQEIRDQWAAAGLVTLYEVDRESFLEYPKFREHQKGMIYDREAQSIIPASTSPDAIIHSCRSNSRPTHDLVMSDARVDQAEVKLSEVKEKECKVIEVNPPNPPRKTQADYDREQAEKAARDSAKLRDEAPEASPKDIADTNARKEYLRKQYEKLKKQEARDAKKTA